MMQYPSPTVDSRLGALYGRDSAGASLNEPPPRSATIGPKFSGDLFLVVTLQNSNRHSSARAQKIFPLRHMRQLSIRKPPSPDQGVRGAFPPALGRDAVT